MADRWNELQIAVDEFRQHLAKDFPVLEVVHLYDFTKPDLYKATQATKLHHKPGVYVFYDELGTVLYIGKASWTFDKRVWKHEEISEARYLDVIPFEWRVSYFCLALEYFLIARFKPRYNRHASSYDFNVDDVSL